MPLPLPHTFSSQAVPKLVTNQEPKNLGTIANESIGSFISTFSSKVTAKASRNPAEKPKMTAVSSSEKQDMLSHPNTILHHNVV